MNEQPKKVRCADCGFLSLARTIDGEIVGADFLFRGNGAISGSGGPSSFEWAYRPQMFCSALAEDLQNGFTNPQENEPQPRFRVIDKNRNCKSFVQWIPGFSPKEHKEMQIEESRLKWQAEREDSDRQFQAGVAKESRLFNLAAIVLSFASVAVAAFALWKHDDPPVIHNSFTIPGEQRQAEIRALP